VSTTTTADSISADGVVVKSYEYAQKKSTRSIVGVDGVKPLTLFVCLVLLTKYMSIRTSGSLPAFQPPFGFSIWRFATLLRRIDASWGTKPPSGIAFRGDCAVDEADQRWMELAASNVQVYAYTQTMASWERSGACDFLSCHPCVGGNSPFDTGPEGPEIEG